MFTSLPGAGEGGGGSWLNSGFYCECLLKSVQPPPELAHWGPRLSLRVPVFARSEEVDFPASRPSTRRPPLGQAGKPTF